VFKPNRAFNSFQNDRQLTIFNTLPYYFLYHLIMPQVFLVLYRLASASEYAALQSLYNQEQSLTRNQLQLHSQNELQPSVVANQRRQPQLQLQSQCSQLIQSSGLISLPRIMDMCAILGDSNAILTGKLCSLVQDISTTIITASHLANGNGKGNGAGTGTDRRAQLQPRSQAQLADGGSLMKEQLSATVSELKIIMSQLSKEVHSLLTSVLYPNGATADADGDGDIDVTESNIKLGGGKPKVIDLGASKFAQARKKEKAEKRISELQGKAQQFAIAQQQLKQSSGSTTTKDDGLLPATVTTQSLAKLLDVSMFIVDIVYSLSCFLQATATTTTNTTPSSNSTGAIGDDGGSTINSSNSSSTSGDTTICLLTESALMTTSSAASVITIASTTKSTSSGKESANNSNDHRPKCVELTEDGVGLVIALQRLYEDVRY
jgi:hypothetical protein